MIVQDMMLYDVWMFVCASLLVALGCVLLFEGAVNVAERGLDSWKDERGHAGRSDQRAAGVH